MKVYGLVNKEIVCKAEFNLILPEEIKKYTLKVNKFNIKLSMPIASSLLKNLD